MKVGTFCVYLFRKISFYTITLSLKCAQIINIHFYEKCKASAPFEFQCFQRIRLVRFRITHLNFNLKNSKIFFRGVIDLLDTVWRLFAHSTRTCDLMFGHRYKFFHLVVVHARWILLWNKLHLVSSFVS